MWPTTYQTAHAESERRLVRTEQRRLANQLSQVQRRRRWDDWKTHWLWLAPQTSAVDLSGAAPGLRRPAFA